MSTSIDPAEFALQLRDGLLKSMSDLHAAESARRPRKSFAQRVRDKLAALLIPRGHSEKLEADALQGRNAAP